MKRLIRWTWRGMAYDLIITTQNREASACLVFHLPRTLSWNAVKVETQHCVSSGPDYGGYFSQSTS